MAVKTSTHMRLQKRIPLGKNAGINVSKTGVSLSLSIFPGLSLNLGKNGVTVYTGLPGTGVGARTNIRKAKAKAKAK